MVIHKNLRNRVSGIIRERDGSVVVLSAAAMVALLGCAALAVDMGNFYAQQNRLQAAADAAALAAIDDMVTESAAQTTAQAYAAMQMPAATHGTVLQIADVVFGVWDSSTRSFSAGASPRGAVRVTTRKTASNDNAADTLFGRIIGYDSVDIATTATAIKGYPSACVLALETEDDGAIDLGNGTITAPGCTVHSNSSSPEGIDGHSNGGIIADSICVNGGYDASPTYSVTPTTSCPQIDDPLAALQPPSDQACPNNPGFLHSSGDVTLDPDVYCGDVKIAATGNATFNPGTYVFNDANLEISGSGIQIGTGVTFFMTGTSEIKITGSGGATFSAPTDGYYAGILIYGDRSQAESTEHSLSGSNTMSYEGTIYTPTANVELSGTPGTTAHVSLHDTDFPHDFL